ncbi:MAG: hypothetical protein GYB31_09595 [Bacteroidetes bacterium]|nr:hypothetical protein [Bacteroidota bacterium]
MNQLILNPTRLFRLISNNLNFSSRTSLLLLGFALGFNLLIAWATSLDNDPDPEYHMIWFGLNLLIGGFLFSSYAFNNMSTDAGKQFYLSLPASNLEKFLSKYLITAILFPLVLWLSYWLFSRVADTLFFERKGLEMLSFELFGYTTWLVIKIYFVLQGIFLLGSIVFIKLAIVKISLATSLYLGSIAGIACLFALMLFGQNVFTEGPPFEPGEGFKTFLETDFVTIVKVLFWGILPALTVVLAFLKLKEKEV